MLGWDSLFVFREGPFKLVEVASIENVGLGPTKSTCLALQPNVEVASIENVGLGQRDQGRWRVGCAG